MPNQITSEGIETKTLTELQSEATVGFQGIYGPDINLASNTPDGQTINIFIQMILDMLDFIVQVFNSFDPDRAIGRVLDSRVAYNGIQRQAGTYTLQNVAITITQPLTLFGLDQEDEPVYTVADNAGNNWVLRGTSYLTPAGSHVLSFQAEFPGAVESLPNTITVPVSIIVGVDSINNPTAYSTLGINEETDAILRIRRQKSVSLSSQGYPAAVKAALLNVNGVTSAEVYENLEDVAVDGQPGHSMWAVVAGSGSPSEIAQAIYSKRSMGCNMYGAESLAITQSDSTLFVVKWDVVTSELLYISFDLFSLDGVNPPNVALVREQLPILLNPGVYEQIDINEIATLVQDIDPNSLVMNAGLGLSDVGPFYDVLSPSAKTKQFSLIPDNLIITPILIVPSVTGVVALGTKQFAAYGGFGAYVWTMDSNPSGGSVGVSGLYTAGAVPGVDVVRVTDSAGNFITASVTVA